MSFVLKVFRSSVYHRVSLIFRHRSMRLRPPIRPHLAGDTKYPAQPGTAALRAAVQRKFKRENNLDYALDEILVANGGKQIIFNALLATCNPGDEVVIPAPGWITYADIALFAEATPVAVPCPENNHFKLRADDLDAAITPSTKWLIPELP